MIELIGARVRPIAATGAALTTRLPGTAGPDPGIAR